MLSRCSPEERVRWQVRTLTGHSGEVNSVDWSSDGRWIVSGSDDKLVKIWDAETGVLVRSFLGVRTGWWVVSPPFFGGGVMEMVAPSVHGLATPTGVHARGALGHRVLGRLLSRCEVRRERGW